MSIHFSSKSNEWETPIELFERLDHDYGFCLDAAASAENTKCFHFYDKKIDGLKQDWHKKSIELGGSCGSPIWLNPPYGREIGKWMKKAYEESQKGCTIVCLIPSRTDTSWFHDYCMKGKIEFLRGRLKFGGSKNSAPFPSAIVVFSPDHNL